MDLAKVLAQLHAELAHLDTAIASLQRLQESDQHRGRPPEWLQKSRQKPAKAERRRPNKAKLESARGGAPPPAQGA
jgi:hypothetical protein